MLTQQFVPCDGLLRPQATIKYKTWLPPSTGGSQEQVTGGNRSPEVRFEPEALPRSKSLKMVKRVSRQLKMKGPLSVGDIVVFNLPDAPLKSVVAVTRYEVFALPLRYVRTDASLCLTKIKQNCARICPTFRSQAAIAPDDPVLGPDLNIPSRSHDAPSGTIPQEAFRMFPTLARGSELRTAVCPDAAVASPRIGVPPNTPHPPREL